MLYVPAHHSRYLEKTKELCADCFIYDLGISVPVHQKEKARSLLTEFLKTTELPRRELWVRVNSLSSPWGLDDLRELKDLPIHGIVFPRMESAEEITRAATAMDTANLSHLMLAVMIESPRSILQIGEIASHPRTSLLIAETTSLTIQLHLYPSRERTGLLHSLSQIVLAARAYDVWAIDGSHMNLKDTEGFEFTCRQGRDLGFDGRTLSHPSQIVYANEAYRPSPEDIEWARRIVEALNEAHAHGEALALLADQLLQPYEIDKARRVLQLDEKIRQLEAENLQSLSL